MRQMKATLLLSIAALTVAACGARPTTTPAASPFQGPTPPFPVAEVSECDPSWPTVTLGTPDGRRISVKAVVIPGRPIALCVPDQ
jgi:hypothetical protein